MIKGYDKFDHDNKVKKFLIHCKNTLDLKLKLGNEYYYNSIDSCIIDSVYSLGITYAQTRKVVERYNEHFGLKLYRTYGGDFPPTSEQKPIDFFINENKKITPEIIANDIYKNRCRTSTHGKSLLKSEASMLFAMVLKRFGITYLQDIKQHLDNKELEKEIKKIPGQGTGISLDYFFMLTGDKTQIKNDRMLARFYNDAIGHIGDKYTIREVITNTVEILKNEYPNMTPRLLDHQIWLYQKEIKI